MDVSTIVCEFEFIIGSLDYAWQHEAGHFLVGYLMGVLPKQYEVPSIQALRQNRFAEGNVSFVGFEFLGEVRSFS